MKHVKRIPALILAMLLACSLLVCCDSDGKNPAPTLGPGQGTVQLGNDGQESDSGPEGQDEQELTKKLLSDWFDYLFVSEKCYGNMLWAVSYIDAFLEEPDWDRLQIARMALETAALYTEERDKPEETMTPGDYDALVQQGKDVLFAWSKIGGWSQERDTVLSTYADLRMGLTDSVFWNRDFSLLSRKAQLEKQYCEKDLEFLALETANLLLKVDDEAQAERFRSFVAENCPYIASYADGAYGDREDALLERATSVLDALEMLKTEQTEQLGQARANLNLYADAITGQDWSILIDGAVRIKGLPLMLPYPGWDQTGDTEFYYSRKGEDGKTIVPKEGEALSKKPDSCVITYPGVRKAEFLEYQDFLEELGIESQSASEDADSCTVYYELSDSVIAFEWTEDALRVYMLKNPICFAPLWYIVSRNS